MKTLHSRFHLIALLLLCVFLAVVFQCARISGQLPVLNPPAEEAGNPADSGESMIQSPEPAASESPVPAPSSEPEYNTYGL